MECVEFPQVQYIDLSEMVRVLKAVAIVSCEHLNLWTIFVICHFFCALISVSWREVKPKIDSVPIKSVPFPRIEVSLHYRAKQYKECVNIFPGPNFVVPE